MTNLQDSAPISGTIEMEYRAPRYKLERPWTLRVTAGGTLYPAWGIDLKGRGRYIENDPVGIVKILREEGQDINVLFPAFDFNEPQVHPLSPRVIRLIDMTARPRTEIPETTEPKDENPIEPSLVPCPRDGRARVWTHR